MRYTTTTREESVLSWVRRLARNGEGMRYEIGIEIGDCFFFGFGLIGLGWERRGDEAKGGEKERVWYVGIQYVVCGMVMALMMMNSFPDLFYPFSHGMFS